MQQMQGMASVFGVPETPRHQVRKDWQVPYLHKWPLPDEAQVPSVAGSSRRIRDSEIRVQVLSKMRAMETVF